ncbi:hypothetical protein M434DRAFT_10090 [Hypoxylon sp. CO27-5]|nr:hypothetical protein M434DRAFT_10090 [Hypoxylon sp. CO27-5]
MPAIIHVMRHAQGYHNIGSMGVYEKDPRLTTIGLTQCAQVDEASPFNPDLIISSPMKRTIETSAVSFQTAITDGKFVVLLPDLQEIGAYPCNIGSPRTEILKEFGNIARSDLVAENWFGEGTCNTWRTDDIYERARQARLAIRLFADRLIEERPENPNPVILVTSHGDFIPFLVQDYESGRMSSNQHFQNAEWRTYEFVGKANSERARLRETDESLKRRNAERSTQLEQDEGQRQLAHRLRRQDQIWNRESLGSIKSVVF